MIQIDYSPDLKAALLNGEQIERNGHEQKRADAIAWLGKRYVLHSANRVRKLPTPVEYSIKPRLTARRERA